jgi:hypothetical protein
MTNSEKRLVWFLRGSSVVLLSALVPAVMPFQWMVEIHARLGLGTLPDQPIIGYLTRSLSAMYALHGALVWYVSLDVRRHLGVVRCLGGLGLVFGAGMIVLDLAVGLPIAWAIGEGTSIIVLGAVILILAAGAGRERGESGSIS